ncbi:MAG: insulinase family protein [Pseudomonadota bacterium]
MYNELARRGLRNVFLVSVAVVLASCATVTSDSVTPVKSPNDKYEYRLITLDNDLEALLISAPNTPKAAAALAVQVGSGDNPPGRGGLAHFLEHMLFLGTEKYPDAAEYEEYITEHGGSRNAYTAFEQTNYFFDIDPQFLPEALDRFAQFFVAPLFDDIYIDREQNAVQAEYQMGLTSDPRRGLDVLQQVMNQDHPYSQFLVGSLETLGDRPDASIRDDLLEFYRKHYSANQMRLAVLGNESLDELQSLVTGIFSEVPNHKFEYQDIAQPMFEPDSLPMFVQIQPQATLKQLEVTFPIADYREDYHTKPVAYLGHLVGHEGEGSLLSALKREGLAESLGAGQSVAWRGGSLFSINVALTDKGLENYQRVLGMIFAYLDMVREEGPQEWLYDEQSRLADLSFRFREQGNPSSNVTGLASMMHNFAPKDVLQGNSIMDDYDPQLLLDVMESVKPDNAVAVLTDSDVETDKMTYYYEVPYSVGPLDLSALTVAASDPGRESLHLPKPNPFIADSVALVALPDPMPSIPQLAIQEPRQSIWMMPDDEFRVPKGRIRIRFRSPVIGENPTQAAQSALYTAVLADLINEQTYEAHLAGLNFGFARQVRSIQLSLSGYNDKQLLLLKDMLTEAREAKFEKARFEDIKQGMIRNLENASAKRPSTQLMDDLREALDYSRWGEPVLIEALQQTNFEDLEQYVQAFWQGATAEALIYGNYPAGTAQQVADLVAAVLPDGPAPAELEGRVLRLESGERARYEVNIDHDDAVVAWYLQSTGDDWQDKASIALTAQIMKSGFFQQLRTEQQLGYIASAFAWPMRGVPGMVMLIQSPVASAPEVVDAMQTFLQGVQPSLDEEQFERHKNALINDITRPDKNQAERADFYWTSINRGYLDFDSREQLAAAVRTMSYQDWRSYFEQVILQQPHSLQVIAPGRWDTFPQDDAAVYDTAGELKQGHAVYEVR